MAGTLNKVMLIGHLGDFVKVHYFEGGNAIGRFPIATNETYTNKQTGEKTVAPTARKRKSVFCLSFFCCLHFRIFSVILILWQGH